MPSQNHGVVIHGQQAFHNCELPHLTDLRPIEIDPIRLARLALHRKPNNPVRRRERVWVDQPRIDHAEHRRRRPNPQCKRH